MTASQAELMAVTGEGRAARTAGHRMEDCPYASDPIRKAAWQAGFERSASSVHDKADTPVTKRPDYLF